MDNIRLAENLIALRKEHKITQEQLADFCGVTKASVSKWETRQTLPDVLLLPRIAMFFGVTVDSLLGYEMYLTKEQIHKIYEELAADFGTKDFSVVMAKCKDYVKQYYSCYEFLEKIILLWIGHEMLAGERRQELLCESKKLCGHILEKCRNISLCNDVVFLQSIVDLLLGNTSEVVEALEDMNNPCRLSIQGEEVLLSAYIQMGQHEKGDSFAQVTMYMHLILLISGACKFLMLHKEDLEKCEKTGFRIETLIKIYNLEEINFYYVSQFLYQMAVLYCYHGQNNKAMTQLTRYVELISKYLCGEINYLQSDTYFDKLDVWFRQSLLDGNFPREKAIVYDMLVSVFEAPEFGILKGEEAFMSLQKKVQAMKLKDRKK